ncbi:MAG: hypothetical protein QOC75_1629, partial [Pseudonocardiales bacterium]|nr:hypothetical protein [Pseudonocardiales bacterium]
MAERVARWSVLSALFLVPLVFYPGALDPFGLPKVALLWLCVFVAVGALLISRAPPRHRLPSWRTALPALSLLAAWVMATAVSVAPWVSLRGLHDRYNGLASLVLCEAVACLIVVLYRNDTSRLREIAVVLAASAVLVTAYILIQFFRLDPVVWASGGSRAYFANVNSRYPPGSLGNSNYAGATLAVMLPFTLARALAGSDRQGRARWLAASTMQAVAIWLTRSRGGLLATIVGLAVFVFLHRQYLAVRTRRWSAVAALLIVAAAVLALAAPLVSRARLAELAYGESVTQRWQFWKGAIGVFAAHPVLGTGPDTFYAEYGPYRPAFDGAAHGLTHPPDKPHNLYLEYAAGSGILGIGAFLMVIALSLRSAAKTLR